jgi:hypothetical protein
VRPTATPTRFNQFWESYPKTQRKVSKVKCEEVWIKKKLDDIADEILIDVNTKAKSKQWLDGFEPAPLTYLNQQRWLDGIAPDSVEKNNKKSGVEKYLENFKDKEIKNEPRDITAFATRLD